MNYPKTGARLIGRFPLSICFAVLSVLSSGRTANAIVMPIAGQAGTRDPAGSARAVQRQGSVSTRDLVSRVRKSLVLISTQDQEGRDVAEASGFFIAPHLVATNLHVLKWASQGYVKSAADDKRYKIATVIAFSLNHDVCILSVPDAAGVPLAAASTPVAVGDDILVAGNPGGLEATFSTGIVSGIRAEAGLLQIDAPISHGSSGGPVVNRDGEAVGLAVSSLISGQNLNFAVPIQFLADRVIRRTLTVSGAGHLAVTDREFEGFHGPVQSFTQKQSTYSSNDATGAYSEGPALNTMNETFDVNGRITMNKKFTKGLEIGSIIRQYSQDGLELREITVSSQGVQQVRELRPEEQSSLQASRIHFDETVEEGTRGTPNYDTCKFNDFGQRVECSIPVQGARYVMKYDESGRETDWLVYVGDALRGKTHFTYEDNEYGDWTVQHATLWNPAKPEPGFIPLGETYRAISYFKSNN